MFPVIGEVSKVQATSKQAEKFICQLQFQQPFGKYQFYALFENSIISDNHNLKINIILDIMIANLLRRTLTNNYTPLTLYTHFRFTQQNSGDAGKPVQITKENAQLIIDKWVKQNKVVLFMKGTPHSPLCGYSNFVVELLKKYGLTEYKSINVLNDPIIREEAKKYRNWPTFPQLYIDGQLIGGSNILQEMHKDKSLQTLLEQKNII